MTRGIKSLLEYSQVKPKVVTGHVKSKQLLYVEFHGRLGSESSTQDKVCEQFRLIFLQLGQKVGQYHFLLDVSALSTEYSPVARVTVAYSVPSCVQPVYPALLQHSVLKHSFNNKYVFN